MKKIQLAIIGAGTVGGGVVELITSNKSALKRQGINLVIKTICVKNTKEKQTYPFPKGTNLTSNIEATLKDPDIDIIVELISDVKVAEKLILASLKMGKHVVTANKAALANVYEKIETIIASNPELSIGIEAAVAGGIPVIGTVTEHLAIDPVTRVAGILNGTTNYIMTQMEERGLTYQEALKEAQEKGYAEADPKADVEGYDARSKLSLLSHLAFGINPNKHIMTQGISRIQEIDMLYAEMMGGNIRVLGVSQINKKKVSAIVSPFIVPLEHNFASINGATNAVSVDSQYAENTFLVGQGAGRYPTATSVLADIIRIAKDTNYSVVEAPKRASAFDADFPSKFYIRIHIKDGLGIVEKIGSLCKKNKISVDSVLQLPIEDKESLPFVLTTDETTLSRVEDLVEEIGKQKFCKEKPLWMPILG